MNFTVLQTMVEESTFHSISWAITGWDGIRSAAVTFCGRIEKGQRNILGWKEKGTAMPLTIIGRCSRNVGFF